MNRHHTFLGRRIIAYRWRSDIVLLTYFAPLLQCAFQVCTPENSRRAFRNLPMLISMVLRGRKAFNANRGAIWTHNNSVKNLCDRSLTQTREGYIKRPYPASKAHQPFTCTVDYIIYIRQNAHSSWEDHKRKRPSDEYVLYWHSLISAKCNIEFLLWPVCKVMLDSFTRKIANGGTCHFIHGPVKGQGKGYIQALVAALLVFDQNLFSS